MLFIHTSLASNGVNKDHITVIPNGVDCEDFICDTERKERIITYLGGQNELKGYNIFFEIAKKLKTLYPDVRLIATGNFNDKSQYVEFVGNLERTQVKELLTKSLCTVVPSIWDDPFPAVSLESMASGTPVVAFDIGSLRDIIEDGKTGFIIQPYDTEDMLQKIIKLLTNNDLLLQMSRNSREMVCKRFNESQRINNLINVIQK